ncbi:MAG TPA: CDP-alcohol phosphatidyltransferase family protein [Acidimicrobiia bacterium]
MTTYEDRILTVPNLVTFIRLVGVGVFWWLLLTDRITAAAWLIVVVGWTDWVDGFLARRLGQVSRLGKALDPVADRLMIASAVIGGLVKKVVPLAIGTPLLLREVVMAGVAAWVAAKTHGVLEVRPLGKLATFILYGAIPAFYLAAAGVDWMRPIGWAMGVVGLALYWWVLFQYVGDARRRQLESQRP